MAVVLSIAVDIVGNVSNTNMNTNITNMKKTNPPMH